MHTLGVRGSWCQGTLDEVVGSFIIDMDQPFIDLRADLTHEDAHFQKIAFLIGRNGDILLSVCVLTQTINKTIV